MSYSYIIEHPFLNSEKTTVEIEMEILPQKITNWWKIIQNRCRCNVLIYFRLDNVGA